MEKRQIRRKYDEIEMEEKAFHPERFQLPHARCDRHDRDTFRFLHAPFETTPALTGFASRGASDSVAT
ncbi:uncharacterized protein HKW66_Vig0019960 [Vigna angularis]|uniref:Uncharacterized protein n=1 Tax=Phaseolus angularis TaxID=3914 RepID=A0A8T0L5D6_PHAAN|nr:uncharacterized protein HKW66_Vig0019960 [Vigna angularis]